LNPAGLILPAWAAWLAQDADGALWAFEAEPNQHDIGWYENEVGRYIKVGHGPANPDWREALIRIHPSN
jgi:hypothetical protein